MTHDALHSILINTVYQKKKERKEGRKGGGKGTSGPGKLGSETQAPEDGRDLKMRARCQPRSPLSPAHRAGSSRYLQGTRGTGDTEASSAR